MFERRENHVDSNKYWELRVGLETASLILNLKTPTENRNFVLFGVEKLFFF